MVTVIPSGALDVATSGLKLDHKTQTIRARVWVRERRQCGPFDPLFLLGLRLNLELGLWLQRLQTRECKLAISIKCLYSGLQLGI